MRLPLLQLATVLLCGGIAAAPEPSWGQHAIDVERLAAEEDYFRAMVAFERLPARKTTTATHVAAGRSAWGLGLSARAIREFERALRDETLSTTERARLMLSRSILEYQDGRFDVAALFAERTIDALSTPSPLRANAHAVLADSLLALGRTGSACDHLKTALEECDERDYGEISYKFGSCAYTLGQLESSRAALEAVTLDHARAPESLRLLARVALEQRDYESVATFLEEGRKRFPQQFIDSWVDYALIEAAAGMNDADKLEAVSEASRAKYPPSDPWFTILDGATEYHRFRLREREADPSQRRTP